MTVFNHLLVHSAILSVAFILDDVTELQKFSNCSKVILERWQIGGMLWHGLPYSRAIMRSLLSPWPYNSNRPTTPTFQVIDV